jgi:hypothetical protein
VTTPENGADLPLWRVGVVVFASTRAVDYTDAAHIVERAVQHAVGLGPRTVLLRPGMVREVHVADVIDMGMAAGNGYSMLLPTTKAWRFNEGAGESGGLPERLTRSYDPSAEEE